MQSEVLFAGFGGQGVMLAGQFLAYAGMNEGKNVVWLPSYGPEMRGGTACCTVVVSDREIGSPIIDNPLFVAVMNRPSLDKFGPKVKRNGLLIINSSLIDVRSGRQDIEELLVPANETAIKYGSGKAANMAILGALAGSSRVVRIESLKEIVEKHFEKKPNLGDLNVEVLMRGYEMGLKTEMSRRCAAGN